MDALKFGKRKKRLAVSRLLAIDPVEKFKTLNQRLVMKITIFCLGLWFYLDYLVFELEYTRDSEEFFFFFTFLFLFFFFIAIVHTYVHRPRSVLQRIDEVDRPRGRIVSFRESAR